MVARQGLVEGGVALITGAGSGIGRATALLMAAEGAKGVVVSDLDATTAATTAAMIEEEGGRATAVGADVSQPREVDALVALAVDTYGRLDHAVNNAGLRGPTTPLSDYPDESWRQVMAVNLDGVFYCLRAEIRAMKADGKGGSIVNVSSGTTADPKPELGAYVASKFGVLGLTRVAAGECALDNIRVNAVLPGSTRTTMLEEYLEQDPTLEERVTAGMPQRRLGRPEEVAEAIVWLCSSRSSFIDGVTLLADGGIHSFAQRPRPGDSQSGPK